jgi:hypothetical protein
MRALHLSLFAATLFATGCAATPPPATTTPVATITTPPAPIVTTPLAPPEVTTSVVRFDDLGVSFAVPSGFRVIGDDDLAARIRSSANPRLTTALRDRAKKPDRKGFPLLALSKETTERGDGLSLTLTVTTVPKDANAIELLTQQRDVMSENLHDFAITEEPPPRDLDGVSGAEIVDRYALPSGPVASRLRMYVRDGLAFIAVAVWPEGAKSRADEARILLDGLHFYEAKP